jgi:hypothetical protein
MKTLEAKIAKFIEKSNIKVYENNDVYNHMKQSLFTSDFSVCAETDDITTLVDCGNGKMTAYRSEKCSITLSDGSHIHFTSHNNNIDISRVISNQKGNGKILLALVVAFFTNAVIETGMKSDLVLECIGSVGMGNNMRKMDIKDQTSFFRSFGFRKYGKYNPNHIHMKLDSNTNEYNERMKMFA